jgi:hypothetical protein
VSGIASEHLFDIEFLLGEILPIGATPYGQRVIGNIAGGSFEGTRLRGLVLPSGADWGLFRADGVLAADVRCCLRTDDDALIYMSYGGRWSIPEAIYSKTLEAETTESVDPSEYYLRINPLFETGSEKYAWLNRIVAVGVGRRTPVGITYQVFEVK